MPIDCAMGVPVAEVADLLSHGPLHRGWFMSVAEGQFTFFKWQSATGMVHLHTYAMCVLGQRCLVPITVTEHDMRLDCRAIGGADGQGIKYLYRADIA